MKIQLTKDKIYMAVGITALLIVGLVYYAFFMPNRNEAVSELEVPMAKVTEEAEEILEIAEYATPTENLGYIEESTEITIFISGEVENIGVFTLNSGARIVDALYKAGGPTEFADLNRINLANFLEDAEHIIIPSIYDEPISEVIVQVQQNAAEQQSGLVNINTADLQTLQTLPGIGATLAENIIEHRNANGAFSSITEIQNVTRIGPGVFNNISSLITIE
ncbi:MAG: helix-hairpin-helix domain-containing protein [Defluviitaleaceae bacterium]|nr:helix-hairpin-helix domain-containing protein [Defluviitaleaceae bacterium]